MIWKSYEFNNSSINKKCSDYEIYLTSVDWKNIKSSDTVENLEGYHWVKTTPTFARERTIKIEWFFESNTLEWKALAMDYLESLFALPEENEDPLNSSFTIIDELDRRWESKCKIKKPLKYELDDDDYEVMSKRNFEITLLAPDPRLLKQPINNITWKEWIFWGIKLENSLPQSFNWRYNIIDANTSSNIKTPLKIELTVKENREINSPLKIINLTTGEFVKLDISATYWDKIIIDSEKKVCLKNKVDISDSRLEGSTFPYIKWDNKFSIEDIDWWLEETDFDIILSYHDTLL